MMTEITFLFISGTRGWPSRDAAEMAWTVRAHDVIEKKNMDPVLTFSIWPNVICLGCKVFKWFRTLDCVIWLGQKRSLLNLSTWTIMLFMFSGFCLFRRDRDRYDTSRSPSPRGKKNVKMCRVWRTVLPENTVQWLPFWWLVLGFHLKMKVWTNLYSTINRTIWKCLVISFWVVVHEPFAHVISYVIYNWNHIAQLNELYHNLLTDLTENIQYTVHCLVTSLRILFTGRRRSVSRSPPRR